MARCASRERIAGERLPRIGPKRARRLIGENLVAEGGIEPPTYGL